jgi:MFS family permease
MSLALAKRVRFARALQSRSFALLWVGQTVSLMGDGAYFTALSWAVLLLTHSGTIMGIVAIAGMAPRILFLLLGGVAADRLPRRLLLLWSDGGRAVLVLLIAALGMMNLLQLWHLIVLTIAFGFVDGFFVPALESIPPQLVEVELLPSANALTGLSRQMSVLLGPALGALFITLGGPKLAFAFDGGSFAFSALCLIVMRIPNSATLAKATSGALAETPEATDRPRGMRGLVADVREGLHYVLASPWLWVTIAVASIGNMGWGGSFAVAAPKLVTDFYHTGVWLLGGFATAEGLGSMLGTLTIGQMRRPRHRGLIAYSALLLSSLGLIALGVPFPHSIDTVIALGTSAVIGFGMGIFGVIWVTVMQELVPADKLGRVSSIDWLGSLCMTPIGYALAGVLTDRIGPQWVFVGSGLLSTVLVAAALGVRSIRELQ